MTSTTEEYWDVDGVSLNQYGWNIATVGGERYDLPTRRGSNITFAYRPGTVHRVKIPSERIINLMMWVAAINPASGTYPSSSILQWNNNWDTLRRAVWKPAGAQVALTRRWRLTVGGSSTLVSATAQAEIVDAMTPTMTGRTRAEFVMSFLLADPYFYGSTSTTTLNPSTPVTITNPGHDTAAHSNLYIDLIGPLTNPRITNTTASPDVWVEYTGTISTGTTVRLDVGACSAYNLSTGANLIGNLSHAGARYWMNILPGANSLTLSATGGGSASLVYKPPYV